MAGRRAQLQRRDAPSRNGHDGHPNIHPVGTGDWLRIMLYSYPGWGKTSLLGTSAAVGKTLIIHSSLSLLPSRVLKIPGLDEYIADTWEQMLEIQDFLRMSKHGYLWAWWDCLSIDQDALLDDVWAGTIAAKPSRAFKLDDRGKPTIPNLSPSSGLDKGEYGRNMERIQQWIRHTVGANSFHFGITCHPQMGDHPLNDEGGTILRPYVQGKNMTEKICGYMNMVAFLEVMESKNTKWRRLHTRENARFYAHDRYDAFEKGYTDNTDIAKLMAAVEAARGKPLAGNARIQTPARRGARVGREQ